MSEFRPVRVPTVDVECLLPHPGVDGPVYIHAFTRNPADISEAFVVHLRTVHDDGVWLVGRPGGNGGDICNNCAGWNGKEQKALERPRHDLCQKGKGNYRGTNCGCTHDKPHMRGVVLGPDGTWMIRKPPQDPRTNPTPLLLPDTPQEPHTGTLFDGTEEPHDD
jgi:hypothetical protein